MISSGAEERQMKGVCRVFTGSYQMVHCAQNERFITIRAYLGLLLQSVHIAGCFTAQF